MKDGRPKNLAAIAAMAFAIVLAAGAQEPGAKRVLLLAREKSENIGFMLKNEVLPMIALVKAAGYEVKVANITGEAYDVDGIALGVDLKLADARVEDYAGLIVPCMMAGSFLPADQEIRAVRDAVVKGLPLAAQHATELLYPSGAMAGGRPYAKEPGVVRDGPLVTSYNCPSMARSDRMPEDTKELIATFIEVMRERE